MKRAELKRRTPLRGRRSPNRRRVELADKLIADAIRARDRRCVLVDFNDEPCTSISDLDACHLIPKGRAPSVRWLQMNLVAGCRGHHQAFDAGGHAREDWIRRWLGAEAYDGLRYMAQHARRPDVEDVIRELRTWGGDATDRTAR